MKDLLQGDLHDEAEFETQKKGKTRCPAFPEADL